MPNKRICKDCPLYDPSFREIQWGTGRCLLFDSIDGQKRNNSHSVVKETGICRYDIPLEKDVSNLTAQEVANYANSFPMGFTDRILIEDIRLKTLEFQHEL